MNTRRYGLPLAALLACCLAACSEGGEGNNPEPTTDGGVEQHDDAGQVAGPDAGPVAGPDAGEAGPDASVIIPEGECGKAANAAKMQQLAGSQPTLAAKSKAIITAPHEFKSVADDPSITCKVDLRFKDLNGNGTVEPYENWTLTAAERSADLVGRMSADQKLGLMAHATLTDIPATAGTVSAATEAIIAGNVRFGRTAANTAAPQARAIWANNIQEKAEASALGIPFVLSMEPSHTVGNGRIKARGFYHWPAELGLAASNDPAIAESFGKLAGQDYRAIGVRMALSPSAALFTDPRWFQGQFTFGEDGDKVGSMVEAYIRGFQGATLGKDSVACVATQFVAAGAAKDGWDARLEKGKFVALTGTNVDKHFAPFKKAFDQGVAGVMPGYGILESGTWTGLNGLLDGTTLEQVGASFNQKLLTDVLRTHYQYKGLVLAPWGVLENKGTSPLGAPWGMETKTKAERIAKAVIAGVDQFGGLDDITALQAAKTAGGITDAQIDASAGRALALMFQLGLFENPYVDAAKAAQITSADATKTASLKALNASMVLIHNAQKPAGWLNGGDEQNPRDGTQSGDPGNAGNGTLKVLPSPPGQVYVAPGCSYYIQGDNWDLDYIRSVSQGYGNLTNDAENIGGVPASTPAEKMALTDYVYVRLSAPFSKDTDSGTLNLPKESLTYSGNGVTSWLEPLRQARAAIDAKPGSKTQIVVGIDSGRPAVLDEIMAFNPSAIYLTWMGVENSTQDDKVYLDVAFGIVNGTGKLPVGVPLSDAAVQGATQKEDVAGDGQHSTYVTGFGVSTTSFF